MVNIEFDAHNSEPAVVMKCEMEAALDSSESLTSTSNSYKKIIQLKELNDRIDTLALAQHIIKVCPIIPEQRIDELEQVLYYLQKRHCPGVITLATEDLNMTPTSSAHMSNIDEYIEMLYNDVSEKTKATSLFAQLSQNHENLQHIVGNEVLLGALVRVLRDDWKKNFELAINIVTVFYNLSIFTDFHPIISHHKIGTLSMQIIEYELQRWKAWAVEARCNDWCVSRRLKLAIQKEQQLIASCLDLLLNLAEDVRAEVKMINRKIIPMLAKCIEDRNALLSLHLSAANFLLKLSVYMENKNDMINSGVVKHLSSLFPIKNESLRHTAVRLLFNLSFIRTLRDQMVSIGLVSHIASLIDGNFFSLFLSINDEAKAMITYTDALKYLMQNFVNHRNSEIVKAILINLALEKRNAQLLCGLDGQGLDFLIETALDQKDPLLLKIVRNIAVHGGPTQAMFSKWASRLLEIVVDEKVCEWLDLFALECLGIANQLNSVDWAALAEQISLISWIENNLKKQILSRSHTDHLLQIVILCGTMARQLQAARLIIPLTDQLLELLTVQQEDDEMVIQVVYIFYAIITHEELSGSVMDGSTQIGAYLIDLMHDRNGPIRSVCDHALSIIAERNEEWAQKMDVERFRWHNAHWLEMVADNNSVVSVDSVLSGSSDIFNDILGAEDILDDESLNISVANLNNDF